MTPDPFTEDPRPRRRDPIFARGLVVAAMQGRLDALQARMPVSSPFDPCVRAVAEWRARGMAGLRNRHFRKRSLRAQASIKLNWSMRH